MQKFFSIILALNLMCTTPSLARVSEDDCSDKDFSEKLGAVRDQGADGICYAMVSADLISFAQGVRASTVDVAYNVLTSSPLELIADPTKMRFPRVNEQAAKFMIKNQFESRKENTRNRLGFGGQVSASVLAYNNSGGLCRESDLSLEDNSDNLTTSFLDKRIESLLKEVPITDTEYAGATSRKGVCYQNVLAAWEDNMDEFRVQLNAYEFKRVGEAITKACSNRIPIKRMSVQTVYPLAGSSSNASALIAEALGHGYPMAMGTTSCFLQKDSTTCRPHVMIAAGRRWNRKTNSCEFKIRNSWGTSCKNRYKPIYEKACEGGNIWMSENDINNQAIELNLVTLERQ